MVTLKEGPHKSQFLDLDALPTPGSARGILLSHSGRHHYRRDEISFTNLHQFMMLGAE